MELPTTGTDDARRLVKERSGLELTGDPEFIRLCRASDPSSPRRQRDVLLVADEDDPEVVTVHLAAWVMPAR